MPDLPGNCTDNFVNNADIAEKKQAVRKFLLKNDIQTLIHYPIPPHKQKCYEEYNNLSLPITEKIHAEELSLPMSPFLTNEDIEKVINVINKFKNG